MASIRKDRTPARKPSKSIRWGILLCALALVSRADAQSPKPSISNADLEREHARKGAEFREKHDWDGALREYREAIRIKPNDPDTHQALGSAFFERDDVDGALREYREAVRLKPDSAEAHSNVGLALSRKGDRGGRACGIS